MKPNFFNSLLLVLFITLIIAGRTPGLTYAEETVTKTTVTTTTGDDGKVTKNTETTTTGADGITVTKTTGDSTTDISDTGSSTTDDGTDGGTVDTGGDTGGGTVDTGGDTGGGTVDTGGDTGGGTVDTGGDTGGAGGDTGGDNGANIGKNTGSSDKGSNDGENNNANLDSKSDAIKPDTSKSDTGSSGTENSGEGNSDTSGSKESEGSSSSSGSSGMNLVSSQPASNIYSKELVTRSIMGGYPVRFDFLENVTCITHIEFTPMKTFRKTTTMAEVLRNISIFTPEPPTGKVYKYVDILVGDKGAGLPTSLINGFVGFKVEKSWLNNSTANESTMILQWYDNGWHPLYTEKIGEDENYVFYEAEVSAYSSFAITENTGVQKEDKKDLSVAEKLQQTLKTLTGEGNEVKISSVKKGKSKIENPMGLGKTIIAISFPLFMAIAGYCILKKKI